MKIKNLGVLIKTMNICTGIGLVVIGVLSILNITNYISFQIFLVPCPFFVAGFGLALLGAEFKIKAVLNRMAFLKTLAGRGLFNIFLSSLAFWFLLFNQILAWVSALILFITGIIYIVVDCGYGKQLKKQIEEDQKKSKRKSEKEDDNEKIRDNLI